MHGDGDDGMYLYLCVCACLCMRVYLDMTSSTLLLAMMRMSTGLSCTAIHYICLKFLFSNLTRHPRHSLLYFQTILSPSHIGS